MNSQRQFHRAKSIAVGFCVTIALQPNGKHFASSKEFPDLFSVADGSKIGTLGLPVESMWGLGGLQFSSSGRYIACRGRTSGSRHDERAIVERTIVWDIKTNDRIIDDSNGPGVLAWDSAFSHSEAILAVVSCDQLITFWDLNDKRQVTRVALDSKITGNIAFSPDDKFLAAGCADGIKIYRVADLLKKRGNKAR